MQDRVNEIYNSLDVAAKDLIEKNNLPQLQLWARLIDEVEANFWAVSDLSNAQQQYTNIRTQFEQLLNRISAINIAQDANSYANVQNDFSNFKGQYFPQLIELKKGVQAVTNDLSDVDALKKVVADAKKQKSEFEKSFASSLRKQSAGSQRTLATYFDKRLTDIKNNDDTNPAKWLEKRRNWLYIMVGSALVLITLYLLFLHFPYRHSGKWHTVNIIEGFEIQIAVAKVAIIALLYTQYHFATRNYYVYSDIVAKYEHLAVISKTMTDFIAVGSEDLQLKEAVLSNASKTLFSEINTGLTKQPPEPNVFENIINQLPTGQSGI